MRLHQSCFLLNPNADCSQLNFLFGVSIEDFTGKAQHSLCVSVPRVINCGDRRIGWLIVIPGLVSVCRLVSISGPVGVVIWSRSGPIKNRCHVLFILGPWCMSTEQNHPGTEKQSRSDPSDVQSLSKLSTLGVD